MVGGQLRHHTDIQVLVKHLLANSRVCEKSV